MRETVTVNKGTVSLLPFIQDLEGCTALSQYLFLTIELQPVEISSE